MDVVFKGFFDAKELSLLVKSVDDCKDLVTERTQNPLNREALQRVTLGRAGEGPNACTHLYRKNIMKDLSEQLLSAASELFSIKRCPS